jgi:hypothetical protein
MIGDGKVRKLGHLFREQYKPVHLYELDGDLTKDLRKYTERGTREVIEEDEEGNFTLTYKKDVPLSDDLFDEGIERTDIDENTRHMEDVGARKIFLSSTSPTPALTKAAKQLMAMTSQQIDGEFQQEKKEKMKTQYLFLSRERDTKINRQAELMEQAVEYVRTLVDEEVHYRLYGVDVLLEEYQFQKGVLVPGLSASSSIIAPSSSHDSDTWTFVVCIGR